MKLGYNQICINPISFVQPIGYADSLRPTKNVREDLYVRYLCLETDTVYVILITIDCRFISFDTYHKIKNTIQKLYPFPVQIIISCSNTHFSASLSNYLDFIEADQTYFQYVLDKIISLLHNCKLISRNLTIGYSIQPISFIHLENTYVGTFCFYENNTRIGSICHSNIHPLVYIENNPYLSSDFMGVALSKLHKKHPSEFALFLQGSCGEEYTNTILKPSFVDSIKLGNQLYDLWIDCINSNTPAFPLETIDYKETLFQYINVIKNRSYLDTLIKEGALIQNSHMHEILSSSIDLLHRNILYLPTEASITCLQLAQYKLIFHPFKLNPTYNQYIDTKTTCLFGCSQGYSGTMSILKNQKHTVSSALETIPDEEKKRFIQCLKKI